MDISVKFYPLSQPQQSIWFLEKTFPNTSMNIVAGTLRLKTQVDFSLLGKAIQLVIQNNDAMRLRIIEKNGQPQQYIAEFNPKEIDFYDFSQKNGLDNLFTWDEAQTKIPFRLIDSDLFYFALIKISDHDGGVYIKTHHLISDAWSMSIVADQIMQYYSELQSSALIDNNNPSYMDILDREDIYFNSDRVQIDQEYWAEKFLKYPEPVRLKLQNSNHISTKAKRKTLVTPLKLSNKIQQYCRENNVTVFTLFLAALSMYINRAVGKEDIILGTTVLNRFSRQERQTIGMYVSIGAPIRIQINGDLDFKTFVEEMTKESFAILKHQKYPYNLLLQHVKQMHNISSSLFDIALTYQNTKLKKEKSQLAYATRWHFTGHQIESLIININDREDEGNLIIDYDFLTDVFNVKEVEFIHQHVISLLWHALDNPLKKISKLDMLSEKEKQTILYEFNDTKADFPQDTTLHRFFEEQANKNPDNIAVICGDQTYTYRKINEQSNRLARTLQKRGVQADSIVGICLYRSAEMVIGLLAILKAGGAYLPISPDFPAERIGYILRDSGAKLLLTQHTFINKLTSMAACIDLDDAGSYDPDACDLQAVSGPEHLAYVIYTSGSTGNPKGAMIEHRGIVNRIHWMQKKYPLNQESVILQKTPFTFDVSVWELFWWSFVGAKVCMLEQDGEKEPQAIAHAVATHHVTTIHFVPSMLNVFLNYIETVGGVSELASLKQVFASGEALSLHHTNLFNRLLCKTNGTSLANLYGPTEAAVDVSYYDCSPSVTLKTVPIGRPIDNIRLYILDQHKNLLPVGIPGELYIGGVGLARGYVNNPELTAEKFVDDPFVPGKKIYQTGDRCRWFPKGDIEYLGRIDFQIKIHGLRIELGEIETKLLTHPGIKDAVVVGHIKDNDPYLCAYVVTKRPVATEELKDHLAKDLPAYMIPAFFVFLDRLPLSTNGKVDREELPSPDFSQNTQREYLAPQNEIEFALVTIWQEILTVDCIGINENFFILGGDSLKAIILITEIHKKFQIKLSVRDVFRLPTVKQLGKLLSNTVKTTYSPIPKLENKKYYDVSSAQKRLFVLKQLVPEDISYNLPGILSIEGPVDKTRLQQVFRELIARHESLRTSFAYEDGRPLQIIHKQVDFAIGYFDAATTNKDELIKNFVQPFDLSCAPLLRACLIKEDETNYLLLFDIHHIIADGTSINLFIREFADLYLGKQIALPKIQYKEFSAWHNELLQSDAIIEKEAYWLDQFADEIPVLNLPTDFPRPLQKSFKGKRTSFCIEAKTSAAIKKMALETDTTLHMVLLAAYQTLLFRYTNQEDIVIGMPVEGRLHADLQNIMGMFVNTLAIRSYPNDKKTFLQFLQEIKDTLLKAYENQEYPFEELVDKLKVKRDLGRNPLFDTVFTLQNVNLTKINVGDLQMTQLPYEGNGAKFDLTVEAYDREDHIDLVVEYCTDLFLAATIDRMVEHFLTLLQVVTRSPWKKLAEINLLPEKERQLLLYEFNNTQADFPKNKTIHQLFEEQVQKTPESIAVVFGNDWLTYRELNEKANRLAHTLREKGVGRDTIVGISVYRSLNMIMGMLGIVKAGGAYLPIDPDYPEDRIRYMLTNSNANLLLTQTCLIDKWQFDELSIEQINLEDVRSYANESSDPKPINDPHDLLYIIYTSGSTGKPKGVMIEHHNVVRLLFNERFQFEFSPQDVWTLFHSFCFDFSVWEMYGALLYGAKLVIVSKETAIDTSQFLELIKKEKVTVLNQTPAAFYNLIAEETLASDHCLALRYVIFGGEALKPVMLQPFQEKYAQTKLINMYGITETTVHVTFKEITKYEIENNISNIGRPIPTLKTYIVDQNLNLLPIGIPGELCVSGDGLGRGYLNNESYTQEKFIPHPFEKEQRVYRSGDLAKLMPNGELEYLGRIDNQVKIRGFRVELGEIESELIKHPDIKEVLVLALENQAQDRKLYCYYIANLAIPPRELHDYLQQYIPQYMIPTYFIRIDKMPLNKNGKIDRKMLPQITEVLRTEADYGEAQTQTEKTLLALFEEILGLSKIGVHDDFFDLGGDSLSAIRLITKINGDAHQVSLVDLYNNPTIQQLAAKITANAINDQRMLVCLTPNLSKAKANLICFPYGGGNAGSYKTLADAIANLSTSYAVYAVNLPGHDFGSDTGLLPVEDIAPNLVKEIQNDLKGEIILYGHCVGSALLLETAHLLEQEKKEIKTIYIGGILPPKFIKLYGSFFDPWMLHSDQNVINYLNKIGLKKSALEGDYATFAIKAFRHDARSYIQYFYNVSQKRRTRLNTPICFIAGEKDPQTKNSSKAYKRWGQFSEDILYYVLDDADHYFIDSHAQKLAKIIIEQSS